MDLEILAYIVAALMVVLAYLAYRYWHSTATYARRMREAHAHQVMAPRRVSPPRIDEAVEAEPLADEPAEDLSPTEPTPEVNDVIAAEGQAGTLDLVAETDPAEEAPALTEETDPAVDAQEEPHPTEDLPAIPGESDEPSGEEIAPDATDPADSPPIEDETPAGNTDEVLLESSATTPAGVEPTEHTIFEPTSAARPEETTDSSEPTDPNPTEELKVPAGPGVETPGDASPDHPVEPEDASKNAAAGTSAEVPPEFRLIEELEPRPPARKSGEVAGSVAALVKDLDEQLAALPSGIELIDLPTLERRRIANRREELLRDRELLLEQKKRGAHRRRGGSRAKD